MLNMQAFHKWLSSTDETPNTLQGRMARLARVSRARIVEIAGDLVWFMWESPQATGA
jgi:hypothetical protein